jgi:carbamoyl-phosphate synthase large subunit
MDITIGITCIGGHYAYEIIECFRNQDDYNATIIGFDVNPKAKGRFFVDEFMTIPPANDYDVYINSVIEICKSNSIDLFIPSSENECMAVASRASLFRDNGISISIGNTNVVSLMTDKFLMLEYLAGKGVDVGFHAAVNSLDEVLKTLEMFNYSKEKILLKPRCSSGSRGVMVIDSSIEKLNEFIPDRMCLEGNIDSIIKFSNTHKIDFSNYLVSEYCPGGIYDVDCIALNGDIIDIVPRLRRNDNPFSPIVEGCKIDLNSSVISYVTNIVSAFNCHGVCDFDIAINSLGEPQIIDASVRLSGSVSASLFAGVNVPSQLVRVMCGIHTKSYTYTDGACVRPVNKFIQSDS